MRNQTNLAESTIIIEPGSCHLRIGRAIESNPKRFPHCISRRSSQPHLSPIVDPILPQPKIHWNSTTDQFLIHTKLLTTELFNLPPPPPDSPANHSMVPRMELIPSTDDLASAKLFEWESDPPDEQDFFVLNDALEFGYKFGHHLRWPMRYGCLSSAANYTSVLQDLQDIWTGALEKHIGIPRSNFNAYRVILVIEDVYKRNEIRHLVDLLLARLRFGRVFLHQSSVCATYGVGLPTACVINVGDQKTSICCVEDGVAHLDARVTLSVGRSDVLRVFHSLILPKGFQNSDGDDEEQGDHKSHTFNDFTYDRISDIDDLRSCLETAEQVAIESICRQTRNSDDSLNRPCDNQSVSNDIVVPLLWNHGHRQYSTFSIPISIVPIANLLPFSAPRVIWDMRQDSIDYPTYRCLFQLAPNQSSEPDDPFDDLYISLTARERRKRGTNQPNAQNETNPADAGAIQDPERLDNDLADLTGPNLVSQIIPAQSHPKDFANLAEAIWWSINQCATLIGSQLSSTLADPSNPTQTNQTNANSAASDEMRRRLLGCILLCGGGLSSVGSQFVERWLVRELGQLVQDKWPTGSAVNPISNPAASSTPPLVEMIKLPDRTDLAWSGARLLLTTDLINDLWITPTEWKRFGSRAIREKAPFLW